MVEYEYHRDSTEQETKEIQDETAVPEDLSVQTKTKKKELSGGPDPYRLIKEGGIVIGMEKCGKKEKIYYIADDTHTITIGATRSGKTRTLVLQSICLMALAGESMVISDPKAELYQYAAILLEKLGYDVCPKPEDERSDIIEAIRLGSPEAVVAFCQGIQAAAPIDSYVSPEPWDMPGYEDPVVMAAGAFVQGSSIELSADAPIREPYNVYFQGGITYEHSKFGVIKALQRLYDKELISL